MTEAGTVYNETGFTPIQLAESKAELLAACKKASERYRLLLRGSEYCDEENALNKAIAKAENN